MKTKPTAVVLPLAILLLVIAASAVFASSGSPAAPAAIAPAAATATPAPAATDKPKAVRTDTTLSVALDKLVADGTITAAQKQAVLDGVAAERKTRQDAAKAKRDELKKDFDQIKGFLSDGVITKAEFDQLPADSALRKVPSLMADNKITTDELKELGRGLFLGKGRGHHGFPFGRGDKPAASPSPSPAP